MTDTNELTELAEHARRLHFLVATSTDPNVSHCHSDIYKASRAMFSAAIHAAYPDLNGQRIYAAWADCNESVAHCANHVRSEMAYEAREEAMAELTDDEYAIADRIDSVLASVTADGLTARYLANSLGRPVAEVLRVLGWMLSHQFLHTTGRGSCRLYHAGRAS